MASASHQTKQYLTDAFLARSEEYLHNDLDIEGESDIHLYSDKNYFTFYNCSRIDTTGSLEVSIIMGFEKNLFNEIMTIMLQGEAVAEEEIEELTMSISCEITNIIVGNAINNPIDASMLNISPPMYMSKVEQTVDDSTVAGHVETAYGSMLVMVTKKLSHTITSKE